MHMLDADMLLIAYSQGLFPMAESAESDEFHWLCPELRGQLSVQNLHVPKRLAKSIRQGKINGAPYDIRVNYDFSAVMRHCAAQTDLRQDTWINPPIIAGYEDLHRKGYAHSIEVWQNYRCVGGLYGVAIGGIFFGESMFSRVRDASKVALVHLVARLHKAGFQMLDTQYVNPHLEQFGVFELPYHAYMNALSAVLPRHCDFMMAGVSEHMLMTDYFDHLRREKV